MILRLAQIWLIGACALASAPAGAEPKSDPGLALTGLTFVSSRAAANELVLRAERVLYRPSEAIADLEEVHVTFADEDGAMSFEMSCDRGELDLESSDFVAQGHLEGRTADGVKLSTSEARYDGRKRVVVGRAPVRIARPNGSITGDGFEYDVARRRLRVLGTAHMVHGQ